MAEINEFVAENVKRLRKIQKMSLERTARESGVSKSMLGQIERGEANPSVATLGKIAGALKVSVEQLVESRESKEVLLAPEIERKPIRLDGGKVVQRPIFYFDERSRLESSHVDIFISGCFAPEPRVPGCTAYLTVLSGTAEVTVGGELCRLMEWDAIRFDADQPFQVENRSNATVRMHLLYQYRKL
ncbi:XRE family transcriptional regulator [Oscillibacter sp. MSJ-2]|uniref:XRE family transcriptional regulator n=1 Tax=Dysosmobacter acutus TaxID=2841504 RepID=A0ABS6F821_9FIRM|nr:helix-turn-helix domain-containing protein [Dysosmobacter acutus]MBU5626307.1 XRE family transcriptional regulator [Dysosmobacter acutus]